MQNSCIQAGAVQDCQLTPIERKCYTDQVNHYMNMNTSKIHMKLSTHNTRRQNPPKKQPPYFYSVIDKSKYCDGKTPKVLKPQEICNQNQGLKLCCKIPPYYEYNSNKKRFYTTDISMLKNVDSCDPGKCKISGKKCFNDIDCPGEGDACIDPITKMQKSAYEVQIYQKKNGRWSNVEPYTPKLKHPYYIFQEEKRKAAAAAAKKKREDAARAARAAKAAAARAARAARPKQKASNIWQSLTTALSNPFNSIT